MSEVVTFETEMPPETVARAIASALGGNKQLRGLRPHLAGEVRDGTVSIYRRRPRARNLPVLTFQGVMRPHGQGTTIEGRFTYQSGAGPLFMAFGFLMVAVGLFSVAKGAWTLNGSLFRVGTGACLGGAGLAYAITRLGRTFARDEADLLRQEIGALLSGRGV